MENIISTLQSWMEIFGEWLAYNLDLKSLLFIFNIGVVFVLLAIFLPTKVVLYKIDLKKMFNRKITDVPMSDRVKYLHGLSRRGVFRHFILNEESDEYIKLENLIVKAGGLNGCTPDIIHWFKLVLPSVVFVLLSLFYTLALSINYGKITQKLIGSNITPTSGIVVVQNSQAVRFNPMLIFVFIAISAIFYYLPERILKVYIKARKQKLQDELPVIEMFIAIYLDAGYNVYDILKALSDVVVHSKKYIIECINEFYIHPERAIQNMADKINIDEYQLVCDILKQAINTSEEFASSFVRQHMDQINKIKDLTNQAKIKKKPLIYTFVLALPLMNIIMIWFYPWIVKALKITNFTNI